MATFLDRSARSWQFRASWRRGSQGGPDSPLIGLSSARTSGTHFFATGSLEDTKLCKSILFTDGYGPAAPFIVPEDGAYVGTPRFAHSHFAGSRPTVRKASISSVKWKLWASPYSSTPSELKPYKVADTDVLNVERAAAAGGFGRFAMLPDSDAAQRVDVWNLAERTIASYTLPSTMVVSGLTALTRAPLWCLGAAPSPPKKNTHLIRFAIR